MFGPSRAQPLYLVLVDATDRVLGDPWELLLPCSQDEDDNLSSQTLPPLSNFLFQCCNATFEVPNIRFISFLKVIGSAE